MYSSPYDDPYYYYGGQERGAPQATTIQDPLFKNSGYGVTGLYDADGPPPGKSNFIGLQLQILQILPHITFIQYLNGHTMNANHLIKNNSRSRA